MTPVIFATDIVRSEGLGAVAGGFPIELFNETCSTRLAGPLERSGSGEIRHAFQF